MTISSSVIDAGEALKYDSIQIINTLFEKLKENTDFVYGQKRKPWRIVKAL